jgi:CheY-like chemotaxis protein
VAKILVADDNSNVQKTVALALSELGVDVVAVNNGDAAVRKLADISPDLVLADIFMPVRNGYEVCEYIKKDSRFSHVPVVLLVGAFDPLDEREAQRVGADGILKKPFVPPDPLITMVKTLLERSGGSHLAPVAASKPAVSVQAKFGGVTTAVKEPAAPEMPEEESPVEEFQPPVDRVTFGEGERPIAFGQLLDTPSKETGGAGAGVLDPVDDEQVLTSHRDAALGDPIFWKAEEPESDTEEEISEPEEEKNSSSIPTSAWKQSEEAKPAHEEAAVIQPVDPFELVRDQQDEETGQASTIVERSSSILQDAASQASLTVESKKPEDLAANPIEWMASAPPQPVEETPESIPEWSTAVTEDATEVHAGGGNESEFDTESTVVEPSSSFFHPASLASSTPAPQPELPQAPTAAPPQIKVHAEIPEPPKPQPSAKSLEQSAEEAARSILTKDWSDLAAGLQLKPIEFGMGKSKPTSASSEQTPAANAANDQSAQTNSTAPAAPDSALVEAVVQRVLDKMRPQVVDIITKEFLRPIVQALVHREIDK